MSDLSFFGRKNNYEADGRFKSKVEIYVEWLQNNILQWNSGKFFSKSRNVKRITLSTKRMN